MLVIIQPAEEVILFTFGNICLIPRHRPTLDRLKIPNVPSPIPSPSPSTSRTPSEKSNRSTTTTPNRGTSTEPESVLSTSLDVRLARNYEDEDPWESSSDPYWNPIDLVTEQPHINIQHDYDQKNVQRKPSTSKHQVHYEDSNNKSNKHKLKPKLPKLHIGLHRSSISKTPESSRVKEDVKIQVANPTFTRQNLYDRNFDAFFQSGEAIVSRVEQ